MEIFKKLCSQQILKIFLVLVFVSDFITKINLNVFQSTINRVSSVVKVLLILFLLTKIKLRNLSRTFIVTAVVILLTFIVGQYMLSLKFEYDLTQEFLSGNIFYFFRFYFIVFIIAFFHSNYDEGNDSSLVKGLMDLTKSIILINTGLIVLSFIFNIVALKSYHPMSNRFGYGGIFTKVGEATYIYLIVISYLYVQWIQLKKNIIQFLFVILGALLLGTKAVYLFITILAVYHFSFEVKQKKMFRMIAFFFISIVLLFHKKITMFLVSKSAFWEQLSHKYDYITLLTSTRDILLLRALENIERDWTFLNYFVGGIFYSKNSYVEFELVDVFLFFGTIGLIGYIALFAKFIFKPNSLRKSLILSMILFISFLAGGFLLSVNSVFIFYLFTRYLNHTEILKK